MGLKLLANSNSYFNSCWKVGFLLSRLKFVWAMVLQQIKSGQFIFASYRLLRYVISAKCCKNLLIKTLEISLFSEQLRSNVLFHQASLLSWKTRNFRIACLWKGATLSHIFSTKDLFLCKPSEKAGAKVRNSMVCQWLPAVILLLTRRFLCFYCFIANYSKILFPVSVHLSKRLLFLNKRGLSTAFTSNVTGENTEQNTSPKFERYKIQY